MFGRIGTKYFLLSFLLLATWVSSGRACLAQTFRLLNGQQMTARELILQHPELRHHAKIPPNLRAAGVQTDSIVCATRDAKGAYTRTSAYGIFLAASTKAPPGAFPGQSRAMLRNAANNFQTARRYLVDFALNQAQGDPVKAIRIVQEMDRSDARCFAADLATWQSHLRLMEQGLTPSYLSDGTPVVVIGTGTQLTYGRVMKMVQNSRGMMADFTKLYGAVFQDLSQRRAPPVAATPQPARPEAPKTTPVIVAPAAPLPAIASAPRVSSPPAAQAPASTIVAPKADALLAEISRYDVALANMRQRCISRATDCP